MFDVPDAPWIGMGRDEYESQGKKVVCTCEGCGAEIYDGEDYFSVMGDAFCENCVTRRTAEYDGD